MGSARAAYVSTAHGVKKNLIAACRRPRAWNIGYDNPVVGEDLLWATAQALGVKSPKYIKLIRWAWASSHGTKNRPDPPITDLCNMCGWTHSTFYRHLNEAAQTVANHLNERRK